MFIRKRVSCRGFLHQLIKIYRRWHGWIPSKDRVWQSPLVPLSSYKAPFDSEELGHAKGSYTYMRATPTIIHVKKKSDTSSEYHLEDDRVEFIFRDGYPALNPTECDLQRPKESFHYTSLLQSNGTWVILAS